MGECSLSNGASLLKITVQNEVVVFTFDLLTRIWNRVFTMRLRDVFLKVVSAAATLAGFEVFFLDIVHLRRGIGRSRVIFRH